MATNKRIRSRSRSARELANEPKLAPRAQSGRDRARNLASEIHRLEVEIVATQRLAREHRARNHNMLPALDRERSSAPRGFGALTHSQKRTRRHRIYLQAAQFAVTSCLVVGAGAWLYKLWLTLH